VLGSSRQQSSDISLIAILRGEAVQDRHPKPSGRSCGTCTLCCKVMKISELNKPQGAWCPNCKAGNGCTVYAERPRECRDFNCGYLTNPELGEEWKPSHSKIVVVPVPGGKRIAVHVDPQRPDAWKQEPYYSTLKRWAAMAVANRGQVFVGIGRRTYMIFPDRDVDLGIVAEDEIIASAEQMTPLGIQLEAFKMQKDDPRALPWRAKNTP
jgi:hypothetical protein